MPEDTQLALHAVSRLESLQGPVHHDVLVVLGDDLLVAFVEQDEIFDVVQ